jgi:DNA-binding NarL/FixJ family response regulator
MRHLFISPRNNLLVNWSAAFAAAELFVSVGEVKTNKNEPCLFWLHVDVNSQEWLRASVAQIQKEFTNAKIVVLANVPEQLEAAFVLSLGAAGYCHAFSAPETLVAIAAVVTHGGIWLGQDLLQHLIGAGRQLVKAPSASVESALQLLTPRERDVAQQAAIGLSNKEIARILNITERTVKAHLSASFERLGVKDRLQLALVLNK